MTLATAILFLGMSSIMSVDSAIVAPRKPQSSSTAPSAQEETPKDQAAPHAAKPSAQSPGKPTSAGQPKAGAPRGMRRRKTEVPASCDPAPANSNSTGSNSASTPAQPGSTQTRTPEPSKNCPPAKIIVRQGGISEQAIQLAGGSPSGDTTQEKESTNQMLAETEENLKKLAGIQLSAEQQSSVSQIRQFLSQSRSAFVAADFQRAHTLAWKAKVLSDDLVNPKK